MNWNIVGAQWGNYAHFPIHGGLRNYNPFINGLGNIPSQYFYFLFSPATGEYLSPFSEYMTKFNMGVMTRHAGSCPGQMNWKTQNNFKYAFCFKGSLEVLQIFIIPQFYFDVTIRFERIYILLQKTKAFQFYEINVKFLWINFDKWTIKHLWYQPLFTLAHWSYIKQHLSAKLQMKSFWVHTPKMYFYTNNL